MHLIELEEELAGPDREAAMRKYDEQLVALGNRLDAALAEGLPPDEFAKCDGLPEVVTIARKLLRIQVRQNSQ